MFERGFWFDKAFSWFTHSGRGYLKLEAFLIFHELNTLILTQWQRIKKRAKTKQLKPVVLARSKIRATQTPHRNYSWFLCPSTEPLSSPASRRNVPAKHRTGRTHERTTHSGQERVLRRTATPTGLLLCRPRTGGRSNQSPCFRGTRSWGKRSSMEGCVQTHTPATEGKDKWAGASAEQGQKQESRLGGPGSGPGAGRGPLHGACTVLSRGCHC